MEATGIYYEQVAEYLSALYTVYVINPLKIKEYAKSQFKPYQNRQSRFQKLIAEFANRHLDKLTPFRPSENPILYKLVNLLQQLKEQQKETQNRCIPQKTYT
ncbi:invertase related gene 7, phage associated protein [Neisseria meningitidis]|nr:invertase related gene 7, phage associated protein [Neisseria meningitidis]